MKVAHNICKFITTWLKIMIVQIGMKKDACSSLRKFLLIPIQDCHECEVAFGVHLICFEITDASILYTDDLASKLHLV